MREPEMRQEIEQGRPRDWDCSVDKSGNCIKDPIKASTWTYIGLGLVC